MNGKDRRELRRPAAESHHRNMSNGSRSSSLDPAFQTVEDIEEGIRLLPIEDSDALDLAKEVAINIHSFCADNANILKELVAFLHEKCLESSSFASRASAVFAALGQFEVAGIKFRDVLLRRIQSDFMGRDDRRLNDHCKFLNSISTLCFVFRRVRLADGATIKILANPIISYFQMLLENNFDEDIELLSTQLQILGPELAKHEIGQLDSLMMALRQRLITSDISNLSSSSRSGLILVLELFLLGWPKKLSDPIEAFYSKCLPQRGRCIPMQAQSNESDDTAEPESHTSLQTSTSAASQDLYIGKSSMIEMNLAALAAQMSSLQQQEEDPMGQIHGWEKDPEMWNPGHFSPKTFSRPPPPIMNPSMNRPGLHSMNDYSNVHQSNLRR